MGRENSVKKLLSNSSFRCRIETVLRKAEELATLFDVDVAFMVFKDNEILAEFPSTNMQRIISRYRILKKQEGLAPAVEIKQKVPDKVHEELSSVKATLMMSSCGGKDLTNMNSQELRKLDLEINEALLAIIEERLQMLIQQLKKSRMQEPKVVDIPKEEISKLVIQQLSLSGKAFTGSMFPRLIDKLERGLNEGLLSIWNTKQLEQNGTQEPKVVDGLKEKITNIISSLLGEDLICIVFTQELGTLVRGLHDGLLSIWQQMLKQQRELSRMKEKQTMLTIETLRRKADILRSSCPSTSSESTTDVLDTDLQFGLSYVRCLKRKMPDGETPARD